MADMTKVIKEAQQVATRVYEELSNAAYLKAQEAAFDVFKKHGIEIDPKMVQFDGRHLTVRTA